MERERERERETKTRKTERLWVLSKIKKILVDNAETTVRMKS
jgi:hypothetical protein